MAELHAVPFSAVSVANRGGGWNGLWGGVGCEVTKTSHPMSSYDAHTVACHRKNDPDKNSPDGPILDEKMVRPDQFW